MLNIFLLTWKKFHGGFSAELQKLVHIYKNHDKKNRTQEKYWTNISWWILKFYPHVVTFYVYILHFTFYVYVLHLRFMFMFYVYVLHFMFMFYIYILCLCFMFTFYILHFMFTFTFTFYVLHLRLHFMC